MDKAVKKKVCEAVKKKLKEIGFYVADELPDYIMVMVANRKTKSEIEGELEVFLGEESGTFATWLVNLVEDSKCFLDEDSKATKAKAKPIARKEPEDIEVDVLALNPQYNEAIELISKEDAELTLQPEVVPEIVPEKTQEKPLDENLKSPVVDTEQELISKSDVDKNIEAEKRLKSPIARKNANKTTPKKAIYEQKPRELSTGQAMENGDEYDPLYPSFNSLQSVAHTLEKKSSVPLNMQASKLLLFKAMDDANASVCGKDINHVYKPTPIKVLAKKKRRSIDVYEKNSNHREEMWEPMEVDDCDELVWCEKSPSRPYPNLLYPPIVESNSPNNEYIEHQREVVIRGAPEVSEDFFFINDNDLSEIHEAQYPSPVTSPQFVVTLNGAPSSLKRTYSDSSSETSPPENTHSLGISTTEMASQLEENMEEKQEAAPKKQKLLERCRFWPACKNNEDCDYHHPNVLCKTFPNCKFGDKCLYIHPNCKFDSRCTRKDCPFTHVSKRDFPPTKMGPSFHVPVRRPKPAIVMPPLCKFYPNCSAYHCPFLHPNKKCRFGADCNTSNCPYFHQNFPARKQLRWTAGSS